MSVLSPTDRRWIISFHRSQEVTVMSLCVNCHSRDHDQYSLQTFWPIRIQSTTILWCKIRLREPNRRNFVLFSLPEQKNDSSQILRRRKKRYFSRKTSGVLSCWRNVVKKPQSRDRVCLRLRYSISYQHAASESHGIFLERLNDRYLKGQAVWMSGPSSEQIKYSAMIQGLGMTKDTESMRQIGD